MTEVQVTRFTFDNSFDDLDVDDVDDEVKKVKMTQEDFEAALADSFEKGRQEGNAESRQSLEQQAVQMVAQLGGQLQQLAASHADVMQKTKEDAINMAYQICRKILPATAAKNALTEIEQVVAGALMQGVESPVITVRLSSDDFDLLKDKIEKMITDQKMGAQVKVVKDESLSASDCCLEWQGGGTARNMQNVWQVIDQKLGSVLQENFGELPTPETAVTQDAPTETPNVEAEATEEVEEIKADDHAPAETLAEESEPETLTGEKEDE